MPASAYNKLSSRSQFYRFAGLLSPLDVAAACCVLTIEHPQFTPEALQSAKILNVNGKIHLALTDSTERLILSLDKPRAGKRKTAILSPVSLKILREIMDLTKSVRIILKKHGDKGWRHLFLGCQISGRLGAITAPALFLSRTRGPSLCSLYPALPEAGLTSGTFDYRRIRTTMGVLRWFETGSISEMSRRLGNSTKVVIEHYLPPALLKAWNTRLIRRFQNVLIVLAAHSEDYLLDVADFPSFSELQNFIGQMLIEYPNNSSPLANEIQSRFASKTKINCDSTKTPKNGLLNIRLSPTSLAYLYAFSDFAAKKLSAEELDHVDARSQLAPIQFIHLSHLIHHACENSEISLGLREILDIAQLKSIHGQALVRQDILNIRLAELATTNHWGK